MFKYKKTPFLTRTKLYSLDRTGIWSERLLNSNLVKGSMFNPQHLTATSQSHLKAVGLVLFVHKPRSCALAQVILLSCITLSFCMTNNVKVVTSPFAVLTCKCRHGKWFHYVLNKHTRDGVAHNGWVAGKQLQQYTVGTKGYFRMSTSLLWKPIFIWHDRQLLFQIHTLK